MTRETEDLGRDERSEDDSSRTPQRAHPSVSPVGAETGLGHFDERRLAERLAERLGEIYPERRLLLIGDRWWTDGNCMIRLYAEPLPAYKATVPPYWGWETSTFNAAGSATRFASFPQTPCVTPSWNVRDEWLGIKGVCGVQVTDGKRSVDFNHRYVAAIRDVLEPDRWTLATTEADATNPTALPFLCAWKDDDLVGAVMPFVIPWWMREEGDK